MRTSTKLKKLLEKNTIGVSYGADGFGITIININNSKDRKNVTGKNFSEVVTKALASTIHD